MGIKETGPPDLGHPRQAEGGGRLDLHVGVGHANWTLLPHPSLLPSDIEWVFKEEILPKVEKLLRGKYEWKIVSGLT